MLEFSRLQEVNTMRVFAELLRSRVGLPTELHDIRTNHIRDADPWLTGLDA